MPCTSQVNLSVEQAKRMAEAIKRLEAALGNNSASLVVGAAGSIAFKGWNDKEGVSDLCAYRALASSNSPALRRAVMRAEALGTKINPRAIAAGMHSHDGGQSWGHH